MEDCSYKDSLQVSIPPVELVFPPTHHGEAHHQVHFQASRGTTHTRRRNIPDNIAVVDIVRTALDASCQLLYLKLPPQLNPMMENCQGSRNSMRSGRTLQWAVYHCCVHERPPQLQRCPSAKSRLLAPHYIQLRGRSYLSRVINLARLPKWIVTNSEGANAGREEKGPYVTCSSSEVNSFIVVADSSSPLGKI